MTPEEAARILDVKPSARRREIRRQFDVRRRQYVLKLQYATDPHERDVAARALALLSEAYQVLTGDPAPGGVSPPGKSTTPGKPRPGRFTREYIVGLALYLLICLAALMVFGKAIADSP